MFDEVQMNSIQIWKYGMYFLVVEYDSKPGLAPPFIIFEHVVMIIRFLIKSSCCKNEIIGKRSYNMVVIDQNLKILSQKVLMF